MIKALVRGFQCQKMMESGKVKSSNELAAKEKTDPSYMACHLRLTLLAPDIVEDILNDKHPDIMTWRERSKTFPVEWPKQREK